MRTGILWILMTAFAGNTQLVSMRISGDTIYILNPSTGTQYKILPTAVGQSGKVLASDGTNYSWITNSSNVAWGAVTGTLSSQSDLNTALNGKQAIITQGTTAQYFRGDLSLATFPTTTAAFTNSTNKNFVTDAQLTVVGNTSGTNTGDNAVNSLYSGLVSNANHTGDATGSTALTLATVNANVGSFGSATQVPTYTVNAKGLITAASNTTIQVAESQVTNLVTDLAAKAPTLNATFTGTFTVPSSVITNANLAGSIDLTTKVTGILPFASNAGSSAATSATTGTMTVNMTTPIITITPTGACTFNGSGGVTGQQATFFITTSGVSSFNLTWGTNFRTTGVLATGTTTARLFMVQFLCTNGTQWVELSRTVAIP